MKGVVELGQKPALLQVMCKPEFQGSRSCVCRGRWCAEVNRADAQKEAKKLCVPKRERESHRSWFLTPPTPSNRPKRPEFLFTEVLGMVCCKHSFLL